MKNQITIANLAFLLLLICKVGHIGTLDQIPEWKIICLLAVDPIINFAYDFSRQHGWWNRAVARAVMAVHRLEIRRAGKRAKKEGGKV